MGRNKKKFTVLLLLITFILSFAPVTKVSANDEILKASGNLVQNINLSKEEEKSYVNTQGIRLQDDFYDWVNGDWIEDVTRHSDSSIDEYSYVMDLTNKSEEDIKRIFKDLLANKDQYSEDSVEKKIINFYDNLLDESGRNSKGIEPVKKYLNKIDSVKNIDELTNILCDIDMDVFNNLVRYTVIASDDNEKGYELYILPTLLMLGNSDEYTRSTEDSAEKKEEATKYLNKILVLSGYSEEEANKKIEDLFKLEEVLAPSILGLQEVRTNKQIDMSTFNVDVTIDDLNSMAPNLKLPSIMKALGIDTSNKIVLQQTKWLKKLNDLYTNENLPLIKNYLELTVLQASSSFLSDDYQDATNEYVEFLNNKSVENNLSLEEYSYNLVNEKFNMALGNLYARQYFSKEEKADVEALTKEIINAYEKRISNNTWISEVTKKNALDKLKKIEINIGYPDNYGEYLGLEIKSKEQGGSLFSNMMNLTTYERKQELGKVNKTVDRSLFDDKITPQEVAAEYHFNTNSIVITAAMLQPDFYRLDKTKEQKLGTIGFIISHEISHAFDDFGALYDSDGNRNNWWTEEDYAKFKVRTNKVKDFYSNIELDNGEKINGDLTLGENIADISGVACILDILDSMPNANYKEFFESYAEGYKCVRSPEFEKLMLQWDSHSPYKYRVNAVLEQFEKFYETYGITEGDKMYVKPEDRVSIW